MRCFAYRSSPLPFIHHQQQQHTNAPKIVQLLLLRSSSSYGFCCAPLSSSMVSQRRNASMNDLLSLPVTKSHPKPGDISVFLQTGGVLLFAYWIANFVVPNWITKSMGYDKMGENNPDTITKTKDNEEDNAAADEEDHEEDKVSSLSKKQGFGSSSSKRKSRRSS